MVAAPVTAAPALQSSKNISPNTHPAATFLANLSPSGVRYFVSVSYTHLTLPTTPYV